MQPRERCGAAWELHCVFGLEGVLTSLHGLQYEMGVGAADALDALDLTVHRFQFVGRGAGDVQQEVEVAGEVVAVGNVGVVDDGAAEAVVVLGVFQADFHKSGYVKAQLFAVDLYFVALDDAAVFHLADAVHNAGNGQVHFLADVGSGFAGVVLKYVQNGIIDLIHGGPPCVAVNKHAHFSMERGKCKDFCERNF